MTGYRYGVDLITFYSPAFWDQPDEAAMFTWAAAHPEEFWTKLLDGAQAAGLQRLEVTFPPGDWKTALAAFGSAEGFAKELDVRGLSVVSGFSADIAWTDTVEGTDWSGVRAGIVEYAEFLREVGCTTLVAGLPMRRTRDDADALVVDLGYAARLASELNEIGRELVRGGTRLALHTEAHSVFWTARDVDLFMLATDPLYVGFCPDTGHIALGGNDPTSVAERHRERLAIAHWKDATGVAPYDVPIDETVHHGHREYFRRVGAGTVDWNRWAALMSSVGLLQRDVLLEIDAVSDPIGEISAAIAHLETTLPTPTEES